VVRASKAIAKVANVLCSIPASADSTGFCGAADEAELKNYWKKYKKVHTASIAKKQKYFSLPAAQEVT
jgi:hypothetical protein